jgi:putative FmdB family regulatory protein
MPVYEYECRECGPFTQMRPMADCDRPGDCPRCGSESPRAFLTAPYFAGMSAERRLAFSADERSANAPHTSKNTTASHGAGCR